VLLAGVGLYAFCNYLLALRTKELAIRAGLGAGSVQIATALLQETVKALVIGSALGVAAMFAGQRLLSSVVFGFSRPTLSHVLVTLSIITGVTLGAVLVPTLRALRISVFDALRVE
jgi:ABC-type antimicrobial peptide transport system permease subunit